MPEIIKTYRQSIPALRFIGKKYGDSDRVDGTFGAKWDGWFANNWFELLKKNAARADFEDGDAAIGLMRYKEKEPGKEQEPFEYWIGIFFPENTPVPDGFEYVDFPASDLGVAWLYGKENEVYCHEGDCAGSCMSKGYNIITDNSHAYWFFERYAQPRFFTPDEKGNIILDICHYIEKENVKMAEGDDSIGVKIIPNVPRIAMFIGSQSYLTPFVGSLYAALQSQGESWQYSDVLAMSGAGNRLRWMPGCWDPGNVDILNCEGNPFAPHFRAFKAVGWNAEVKLAKPIRGMEEPFVDYETARRDILASIDRGIPVIAMGIIGPPECCVVFGYKNDGEKLIGWNYFQTDEGFDGEKPFEKAEWFPNLWGYILLTGKSDIPNEKETGLATLKAIVQHAYKGEVRGAKVGIGAWDAMLEQLERDDFSECTLDFPAGVPGEDATWQNSVKGRFFVYCDALCQIHERGIALPYYTRLAEIVPQWSSELNSAIDAWRECASYGGYLWNHLTMDDAGYEKFRTPQIRKILADEGRRCMRKDIEAVGYIQKLLEKQQISF